MRLPKIYESHTDIESDAPFIFHLDYLNRADKFLMHWHENIELLYFKEGIADVLCNTVRVRVEPGDIAVVNSCVLHTIESVSERCEYYCLIVDLKFCNEYALPVGVAPIQNWVHDAACSGIFEEIIAELQDRPPYYKTAVKARMIELIIRLLRLSEEVLADSRCSIRQLEMVRKAMAFISQHYNEPISVDNIAKEVGYSKYYFCRVFKEITGRPVAVYINELRCDKARQLICSGQANITESAEACGFHNLSYFTRTYKHLFGTLPSAAKKDAEQRARIDSPYVNPCVIREIADSENAAE